MLHVYYFLAKELIDIRTILCEFGLENEKTISRRKSDRKGDAVLSSAVEGHKTPKTLLVSGLSVQKARSISAKTAMVVGSSARTAFLLAIGSLPYTRFGYETNCTLLISSDQ